MTPAKRFHLPASFFQLMTSGLMLPLSFSQLLATGSLLCGLLSISPKEKCVTGQSQTEYICMYIIYIYILQKKTINSVYYYVYRYSCSRYIYIYMYIYTWVKVRCLDTPPRSGSLAFRAFPNPSSIHASKACMAVEQACTWTKSLILQLVSTDHLLEKKRHWFPSEKCHFSHFFLKHCISCGVFLFQVI